VSKVKHSDERKREEKRVVQVAAAMVKFVRREFGDIEAFRTYYEGKVKKTKEEAGPAIEAMYSDEEMDAVKRAGNIEAAQGTHRLQAASRMVMRWAQCCKRCVDELAGDAKINNDDLAEIMNEQWIGVVEKAFSGWTTRGRDKPFRKSFRSEREANFVARSLAETYAAHTWEIDQDISVAIVPREEIWQVVVPHDVIADNEGIDMINHVERGIR